MVAHTSTVQNYIQGLDEGIPSETSSILVEDPVSDLFGYIGHESGRDYHRQEVEDGSARGSGIMMRLEQNSLPGLGIKGTQKPFYVGIKPFSTEVTKFAKFEITNTLIRNSLMNDDLKMYIDHKRMHDIPWVDNDGKYLNIDLTKNYLGNQLLIRNITDTLDKKLYIVKNGKYYNITNLERKII